MFCYSAMVILLCYSNIRCTTLPNDNQRESHGISSSCHTLKHIPYTLKYIDSPAVVSLFMACLQDLVTHINCACFIGTDTIYWLSLEAHKSSCARQMIYVRQKTVCTNSQRNTAGHKRCACFVLSFGYTTVTHTSCCEATGCPGQLCRALCYRQRLLPF